MAKDYTIKVFDANGTLKNSFVLDTYAKFQRALADCHAKGYKETSHIDGHVSFKC